MPDFEKNEKPIPDSIYGPVDSWRLGKSLGVDLLCIDSICSFECVYCQLGKINQVIFERREFIPTTKILDDLKNSDWKTADVITISGSGEPTLALNLGDAISEIRKFTNKPVVVLTNSTLLENPSVRAEISLADKVFCKLDAWSDEILRRVDRPHRDVSLKSIIAGIRSLREEYPGFLAIQSMILRVPKHDQIKRFAEILRSIAPDEVQLNVPTRPIPESYFLETRGNAVETNADFKTLKTISKAELNAVAEKLAALTNLNVISR